MSDVMGGAKLQPNPTLLESAITSDHVEVFRYGPDDNYQFEVSGATDADELDIDWTKIELSPEDVDRVLDDGETYTEQCEDLAGKPYELRVNGGHRHPKGEPIHTEDNDDGGGDGPYEVVIAPDDGLDEEHAKLMRHRLLDDGFHDHAVEVREVDGDD